MADRNVDIFENAGIFFRGIAEFYLDNYSSDLDSFKIGGVEVDIGISSGLLYFLVGHQNENFSLGYELKDGNTIKLRNVTLENTLEYLDKALFKMGIAQDLNLVWPTAGVESDPEYFSELFQAFSETIADKDLKYSTPINNFNGAMRSSNKHEKFLNLYKILEFFWRSAIEETIISLRTAKIDNGNFAKSIFNLNVAREIDRLKHFLNVLIDDDTEEVLKEDLCHSFSNFEKLAEEIYDFRNAIVHAKQERMDEAAPAERFKGEFLNESLLETVEYLALKAIERWGLE